jgi:arylformamidase
MKIIDISWPLTPDMTGHTAHQEVILSSTQNSGSSGVPAPLRSRLCMSSRAGTHVSAPSSVMRAGVTIDQVSLNQLLGTALVLDLTDVDESITRQDLEQYELAKNTILLFKTRNSELSDNAPYDTEFIYLDTVAAQYCIDLGIKAIGIDYLNLERDTQEYPVHKLLFEHNISIIKGLRLAHVSEGVYFLLCMPLALVGLEAAPARAVLCDDFLY